MYKLYALLIGLFLVGCASTPNEPFPKKAELKRGANTIHVAIDLSKSEAFDLVIAQAIDHGYQIGYANEKVGVINTETFTRAGESVGIYTMSAQIKDVNSGSEVIIRGTSKAGLGSGYEIFHGDNTPFSSYEAAWKDLTKFAKSIGDNIYYSRKN